MTFKTRLILLFSAFGFLPVTILGGYQGFNQYNTSMENTRAELLSDVRERAATIKRYFDGRCSDIEFIAQATEVKRLLDGFDMMDDDEIIYWTQGLTAALQSFAENRKVFTDIRVTTFDGQPVTRVVLNEDGLASVIEGESSDEGNPVYTDQASPKIHLVADAGLVNAHVVYPVGNPDVGVVFTAQIDVQPLQALSSNPELFFAPVAEKCLIAGGTIADTNDTIPMVSMTESNETFGIEVTQEVIGAYERFPLAEQWTPEEQYTLAQVRSKALVMAPIWRSIIEIAVMCIAATGLAAGCGFLVGISLTKPIKRTVDRLKDIAQGDGDLTKRVDQDRKDELGEMGKWFNTFIQKVHDIIVLIDGAARDVASASTEIAATGDQMAAGMQDQQNQVAQIAAAVEEMSASVIEVASKSADAAASAQDAGEAAQEGGTIVNQTIERMNKVNETVTASAASVAELGKQGEQIGRIIEVINDIADQTNLLALNAAIEAARAGEHGRGFAVVADEVRKLADRTTSATEEVSDSIQAIQSETGTAVKRMKSGTDEVAQGAEKATEAGVSLFTIVNSSRDVAEMIRSIAAAAEQQSIAGTEISRGVDEISNSIRQAAEGATEEATAVNQLSAKAEQLQSIVHQFKTG